MTEPSKLTSLGELRPDTRNRAELWLDAINNALGSIGDPARAVILETRRTVERQQWLYESGRERPGLIVTNLPGDHPQARHVAAPGRATAFDFAFRHTSLGLWHESHPWELAGTIGERLGFRWGGRWKALDLGHLQDDRAAVETAAPPVLRRGARGEAVRKLQLALIGKRYGIGLADGIFGTATEAAVRAFEESNGLRVDGEVDAEVARLLGISA